MKISVIKALLTDYLKEILIIAYLFQNYDIYIDRITSYGLTINLFLYLILFSILFLSLIVTSYIQINIIRYFFGIIFFVSSVFICVYIDITSKFMSYNSFVSLMNARGFIFEVIRQHFSSIIITVLASLVLFVGIAIKPKRPQLLPNIILISSPILGVMLLSGILFVRGGWGNYGLPIIYTPLTYLTLYGYESYSEEVGERKEVDIMRSNNKVGYDIVLIIDESVSGNYFDINSSKGVVTNLNSNYKEVDIYNYGYAASISNCSSEVNITLRYGGTRNDYRKIISTMPSLWEYAKVAGLSTVYIDAQRTAGELQNGMTITELENVDLFVQLDNVPVMSRDIEIANKLVAHINNEIQELIVVNKIGAHFPIHDKYPDNFIRYTPALARGNFQNISDSVKIGFDGTNNEWVRYRNSYRNTLLWNVSEFFRVLFEKADLSKAIVIYTSDHGQDLHERGNPGKATHCGENPVMEEGLVPLLIIQGKGLNTFEWRLNHKKNKNNSSHYNIFPTILELMAYDSSIVEATYGYSLAKETNDPLTFNTGFHARFGMKPIWRKIDIDKVIEPLESDYNSQIQVTGVSYDN